MNTVWFCVPRCAIALVLFPLAKVYAACELADDGEVCAAADVGFEGGGVDEGVGGEETGAQVAECAELFTEAEDALFRADLASSPFLRRVVSSRPQVTAAFEGDVQVLQQLRG
jgi:hypothetical protein